VFAHGTAKPMGRNDPVPFTHQPHPRDRLEALRKGRLASNDGRITLAMAILGPDWSTWEVVEHDIKLARELGLVASSHTRRNEDSMNPDGYARMAKAGLLGPDHNLVHGTSYDHGTLRMIVDSGATLTSTVLVELHHHIGDTMVAAYREAGGFPSLGIDVELYCSGQMFREMQAALLFARGKEVRNNILRGNSQFKTIPVRSREALEWTTVNGAKAFMMDDKIGTLSPGKKADIVMLRADDVNMAPVHDPVYSIVEIASAGNVDTVIIDGVVRKQNGKLAFPADVLRRRLDELAASGARIMREGGYKVDTAPQ
jgi:5-methylthioadenosine/S-adenosylhomocysteine deaminase